ncbi:MAG TPA: helix-hairpin-helix domain-containing protein [bacterium]|nr:helix-hairpin-helix domain-containing protein [bacterium]
MALSSGQRLVVIILLLAFLSGGGVLGYRISQEYPTSLPQELEKPVIEEPVSPRPAVVTEKAPIRKLAKKEKEKLKAALAININTASSEELQKLYRVGPKTAAKIIAGRPYGRIEDIMKLHGIGEKTFERLKDSITVSGKGIEDYKPPAERAKAPEKEKKMVIVKIDTDGDGIPDTWITRPQ